MQEITKRELARKMQNSRREITKREICKRQKSLKNYLAIVKNTVAYIFKQLQQCMRHQPKMPMELWVANEESHNS